MKRAAFLAAAGAASVVARTRSTAAAQSAARPGNVTLGGVALGSSATSIVTTVGVPASVVSADTGHRWDWNGPDGALGVVTDDEAVVRAIDFTPSGAATFVFALDGKVRSLAFGAYTPADAQAQLSTIADYVTPAGVRTYRLTPTREIVLFFDAKGVLSRAVYGERLTLSRLGYFPTDDLGKALQYRAPAARSNVPRVSASARPARPAVAKLTVERDGSVSEVSVIVSSQDAAFDAAVVKAFMTQRYRPATIGGKAIGATVFREVEG